MGKSIRRILLFSLIIILAAQLNMNLFITDFKISVAVIFFPVFLFLIDYFPLIPVTVCSALGVFCSRLLFYWFQYGELKGALEAYFPEMIFYLCYGMFLYLYTKLLRDRRLDANHVLLPLVLIDYGANLIELLLRIQADAFTIKTQTSILLVAVLRTLVVWCILKIFNQYKLLLLRQEHEERYNRLVLLMSKLNGEVVWMKKNTFLIENTMNTSYQLYEKLKGSGTQPELANAALSVAKDIHEVKKEYLLIMRGISEALDEELKSDGMYLYDLLQLLKSTILPAAKELQKEAKIEISCKNNLYISQHYALMSIIRNLMVNALEASDRPEPLIQVAQYMEAGDYIFTITDDGPGIEKEAINEIFKTGFSTKINYTTGEIHRGLGLNLVQDLVNNEFGGTIDVTSAPRKTIFTIRIPKENIKVVK